MIDLRLLELIIAGVAAVATISATFFAWRAVREGKETVVLGRETAQIARQTLEIQKENLASLNETARVSQESLQLAQDNLQAARQEHSLIERDHLTRRLTLAADAVVQIYVAATQIRSHVVTANVELAAARARLRAALVGLPYNLKESRHLIQQGADPAGINTILRTWTTALNELENAIAAQSTDQG